MTVHKKRHPWRDQDLRSTEKKAKDRRPAFELTEIPCPRCKALAQAGKLRAEAVQRLPGGVGVAPSAHDGSGKCCFDCGFADGLVARRIGMDFKMARIAVANDRQKQYRLPGVPIGLVHDGLRPSAPGDLENQHAWLDRVNWFDIDEESA